MTGNSKTTVLAIILARRNSKRLENKHLIMVEGKPIIQYTFEYARSASILDDIVCSTDGDDIAGLAERNDIEVIKRPEELAGDTSHIIDALEYTLQQYCREKGFLPEVTVTLYGNTPYRNMRIEKGVEFLQKNDADSVFVACDVLKLHPHWMFRMGDNGRMVFEKDIQDYRCQDLPNYYIATDPFIVSKTSALLNRRPRTSLYSDFGDSIYFLEEEKDNTIDIDDMDDLNHFRYLLSRRDENKPLTYWNMDGDL